MYTGGPSHEADIATTIPSSAPSQCDTLDGDALTDAEMAQLEREVEEEMTKVMVGLGAGSQPDNLLASGTQHPSAFEATAAPEQWQVAAPTSQSLHPSELEEKQPAVAACAAKQAAPQPAVPQGHQPVAAQGHPLQQAPQPAVAQGQQAQQAPQPGVPQGHQPAAAQGQQAQQAPQPGASQGQQPGVAQGQQLQAPQPGASAQPAVPVQALPGVVERAVVTASQKNQANAAAVATSSTHRAEYMAFLRAAKHPSQPHF